jgi:hypothetical protein
LARGIERPSKQPGHIDQPRGRHLL